MADKYSTIQQHQPLRVPASFDSQGKAFVAQLEEILDDIYRRFGRLRMQDLGADLTKTIEDKYGNVTGITIDENGVEILADAGDEETKHILLKSGTSEVLIDPTKIKMNTEGKIVLIGDATSEIRLYDIKAVEEGDRTVFVANADIGLFAPKSSFTNMTADTAEIANLTVGSIDLPDGSIPKVVYSETEPEEVTDTFWVQPQISASGSGTAFSGNVGIKAAAAHACTKSGTIFSYKTNLQSSKDLTGVKKIWFSGKINRNGADLSREYTVEVVVNCTDGSTINLGQVGTGTTGGDHTLSFSEPPSNNYDGQARTAKSITYKLTVNDALADYSSFYAGTLYYSGESSGSTVDPDNCTVHYIKDNRTNIS